jgi:1-acyl-sn-glycerol-3-phosphate acyltransferase
MAARAEQFGTIIPARPNARFARVFHWWLAKMMRKNWHAIRLAPGGGSAGGEPSARALLARLADEREPAIAVMNHASWWDPLVGLWLAETFLKGRQLMGPMEAEQLRKFKFFTKLGVFGLEPDDPRSLEEVRGYLGGVFAADPRTVLWITPQGQFADVRTPVRIRPGVAAIAAKCQVRRCVSVAIEYGFWTDKRPEIFLRLTEVQVPAAASTTAWIRAITPAMQANADALAELVKAREPGGFETVLGGEGAAINPLYDWWLRLRGQRAELRAKDRGMGEPGAGGGGTMATRDRTGAVV